MQESFGVPIGKNGSIMHIADLLRAQKSPTSFMHELHVENLISGDCFEGGFFFSGVASYMG